MRTALVHDYLNQRGGAERVFAHIAKAYPQAPIYTSILDADAVGDLLDVSRVRTSFLQKMPEILRRRFRLLAPLYPLAFESFNFQNYDVVVSSTTAWAKGVITRPDTTHVCYINTVSRFAFSYEGYVGGLFGVQGSNALTDLAHAAIKPLVHQLIAWDFAAAQRPTAFIANSHNVAKRVEAYYGRVSLVLPCPVDVDKFYLDPVDHGYALVVSRLLPYKRVDLAIDGCAAAGIPLLIIGSGPAHDALVERARGTRTHFLGQVDDAARARFMAEAKVVILPGEEDFGLVPVEAAAAGRPCIAYRLGGALETILEHETGEFFSEPTAESLATAILKLKTREYDPKRLRRHADEFAPSRFVERLHGLVEGIAGRQTVPTITADTQYFNRTLNEIS